MGKPQLVDKNISMPLNKMGKDANDCSVLDPKEKTHFLSLLSQLAEEINSQRKELSR